MYKIIFNIYLNTQDASKLAIDKSSNDNDSDKTNYNHK